MVEQENSEVRTANAEKPPRPSSSPERAPTQGEAAKQEVIDNELAIVESITDKLKESYLSQLPDLSPLLSKAEKIDLIELVDDRNELAEKMADSDVDALTAAEAVLDVQYRLMTVLEKASSRIQTDKEQLFRERNNATPKGGESYVPKAEEVSVEEDAVTNWTENTPDRSEPEPAAQEDEEVAIPVTKKESDPKHEAMRQKEASRQGWADDLVNWIVKEKMMSRDDSVEGGMTLDMDQNAYNKMMDDAGHTDYPSYAQVTGTLHKKMSAAGEVVRGRENSEIEQEISTLEGEKQRLLEEVQRAETSGDATERDNANAALQNLRQRLNSLKTRLAA